MRFMFALYATFALLSGVMAVLLALNGHAWQAVPLWLLNAVWNTVNAFRQCDLIVKGDIRHGRPRSAAGNTRNSPSADTRPIDLSTIGIAITRSLPVLPHDGSRVSAELIKEHEKHTVLGLQEFRDDLPQSTSTEPIVAYRCWRIVRIGHLGGNTKLSLAAAHISRGWYPGEAMSGDIDPMRPSRLSGVHAFAGMRYMCEETVAVLLERSVEFVVGTVSLWGTVVICDRGYRAQYGYPRQLCWTNAENPEETLRELARTYGVEVYRANEWAA